MKRFPLLSFLLLLVLGTGLRAQNKLTIDKVYAAYLRNSGTIMENTEVKGYFFFYQSDKIDKNTNEYTLQILDQHVNKVKDIKFEDTKNVILLEAAYNGGSLAFLFQNQDTKMLDMKVYDLDGKLKYTYSRDYDSKTSQLMQRYKTMHTDEGTNQNVFDIGNKGYASVLPLRDGKHMTYQLDYFSSLQKRLWSYTPADDEERYTTAEFLGSTDSLIVLEVMKKNRALTGKITAHLVGINFVTRKKIFDLDDEKDEYTFVPSSVIPIKGSNQMLVMGSYFEKDNNIAKDFSKGLAIYIIDTKGKVISRTYNSWTGDFAKYLPVNSKGKIDELGYLYIHKLIQNPDGKFFIVGEGYKRQVSAGGIALTALKVVPGFQSSAGVTKIVITDMVMLEFDEHFKITNASIFEKTKNPAISSAMSDFNSQHAIAMYLKMTGSFDYEFTTAVAGNSSFSVCYSDWVKSGEYKGKTFNSIRYNGTKFTTDKIELKSKASSTKVFPAKPGSVMIMEYYKKEKRLDFRLEKV